MTRVGSVPKGSILGALWKEDMVRESIPTVRLALAVLFATALLSQVISGSNGILKGIELRRLKVERTGELASLEAERDRLAHRSDLLDPRGADVDLADELIRSELGFVRPDEVIVELPD